MQLSLIGRIAAGAVVAVAAATLLRANVATEEVVRATGAPPSGAPIITAFPTPARTQAPRATSAVFALTVSEDELTKAAADAFPQTMNGVTVSDPSVRVEADRVRLTAKAKVLFGTTDFVMTAIPTAADGRVAVRVDTATLAGLSLPSDTRTSIADTVQGTIAKLVPANIRVTSVTFKPGVLTVLGTQP